MKTKRIKYNDMVHTAEVCSIDGFEYYMIGGHIITKNETKEMETKEIVNEIVATARNQKWSVKKIMRGYEVSREQAELILKEVKKCLQ